jgi:dienelactone hydrolase
VEAPEAVGVASPEAVAQSLSTVNPEENLHLFEYDRTAPLDIQEDRRWHEDTATWIDFTYASPQGGRVPARLVIPDGKGSFPGIILQHGGPGTLEDMVDFARSFARYGAVTIMVTSPYRRPGGWEITQYMGNTWPIFTDRDIEIKIQLINDLQRAVDILLLQPEVDPERLAYFGVSWGATMGGLLAGVEDRLVAYVLAVGDGGLVEHTADPGEDGINIHFSENWAARMWPTEPLHYVGRAAPAALLFQNGIHDTFVPPHDALRFFTAASEPKRMIWYDAGHNLPWKFVRDAAEWLQPYLGNQLYLLAPNYRPSARYWEWGIIASILVSLGIFLWDTFRRKPLERGVQLIWLLGIVFLGPIGLILYWLTRQPDADPSKDYATFSRWRQILRTTALMTLCLIIGTLLADQINTALLSNADFRVRFVQQYLTTLVVSWLLTLPIKSTLRISVCARILMMNLFWISVMIVPALLRDVIHIPDLLFYSVAALIAIPIMYPLHAWMLARGLEQWRLTQEAEARLNKPGWPVTTGLLVFSYLAVLGSVVIVVQLYTNLPWRDVILILLGLYS